MQLRQGLEVDLARDGRLPDRFDLDCQESKRPRLVSVMLGMLASFEANSYNTSVRRPTTLIKISTRSTTVIL